MKSISCGIILSLALGVSFAGAADAPPPAAPVFEKDPELMINAEWVSTTTQNGHLLDSIRNLLTAYKAESIYASALEAEIKKLKADAAPKTIPDVAPSAPPAK